MLSDRDAYASANLMIRRFGDDTVLEAGKRADELMAAGDMDGCQTWKRIIKAIEEILRRAPAPGEPVH